MCQLPNIFCLTKSHSFLIWLLIVPAKSNSIRNSTAVEDYLERILELIQSKGYARVVDIAASLKISQASVTNMVQRLDGEGLLKYEKYRGLVLTTAGETLARNITRRHQLLTDFLATARTRRTRHQSRRRRHGTSHQPFHLARDRSAYRTTSPQAGVDRAIGVRTRLTNRNVNNLTRPTLNSQRNRATTDAAILDQRLRRVGTCRFEAGTIRRNAGN